MINLLPLQTKKSIAYARHNTMLRRWIAATLLGVTGILAVLVFGHLNITSSTATWQKQIDETKQRLSAQKLEETQKRVTEISDSVKLASQVLSKQILFSKLLAQIGAVMPEGTSLQSLSIASVEGGIDLSAVAKDFQTATQVQVNLSDPENKIFEKADIVSTTCADTQDTDYPCQITLRALFAKDNIFQYSSNTKQKAGAE